MKFHTLLVGTAGTGKSNACLRKYIEASRKNPQSEILLLLPSRRAVSNFQRDVADIKGGEAVFSANMFTFQDLARYVVREASGTVLKLVSKSQKLFLLQEILSTANIQYFRDSARYGGFVSMLASFFKELGQNLCSEKGLDATLKGAARSSPGMKILLLKGREILLLYSRYRRKLRELCLIDEEVLLEQALAILASEPELLSTKKALIVDGFAHYTRVELALLEQLLKRVPEAMVTLCYAENDPERFSFIDDTYAELKRISSWREEKLDQNRRSTAPELHHLDQRLFVGGEGSIAWGGAVKIIEGGDKFEEVEAIAAEILRAHLDEKVPFEKIGILFRSIGDYSNVLAETFQRYGIPYSLHEVEGGPSSPVISLVFRMCDLICGELTTEKMLAVLKHGLLGREACRVDELEEYVGAEGITTSEHWSEELRSRSHKPFRGLAGSFPELVSSLNKTASRPQPAERFADLIMGVFREFNVIENIVSSGDGGREGFRERVFSVAGAGVEAVNSACTEIVEYCRISGKPKLDFADFTRMLHLAIENSGRAPAAMANSVQISNIYETRSPEYEMVFLPGLVEKQFPRTIRNNPFLKDREREILRSDDFNLPSRLRHVSEERYLFYIACTRASERLYVSYPLTDERGKAVKRSHYVDEVEKLFSLDGDKGKDAGELPVRYRETLRRSDIYKLAARSFWMRSADDQENSANQTAAAAIYNSRILPTERLAGVLLYGVQHNVFEETPVLSIRAVEEVRSRRETFTISVTSLQSFALCPFKFFCESVLRLKELDSYEFSPMEAGSAIHETMQTLYRRVYKDLDEEKVKKDAVVEMGCVFLDRIIDQNYRRILSLPATRIDLRKTRREFREFLEAEVEYQSGNETTPTYFELSFSPRKARDCDRASQERGLEIDSGRLKAVLTGRMDRVDLFDEEGETYGVVIDYKNRRSMGKIKFEDGEELQIPVYLHALEEIFGVKPAGGFYYLVGQKRKRGLFDKRFKDKISAEITNGRKRSDVFPGDGKDEDDFAETISSVMGRVKEYLDRIHDGDISLGEKHDRECDWCPYEKVCRR